MKRRAMMALVLFLGAFFCFGCGVRRDSAPIRGSAEEYQPVRLVMEINGTDKGIDTTTARRFADLVKEASGGNVTIEIYPKDQLAGGNTTKGVAMLADGSVDLAAYTSGNLSMLNPRLAVATLPWAFENFETAGAAIDEGGGAYYEKTLAEQGIIYLGYVHNGMHQISNRVWPVRTPEDLKFLKIRISGNVARFQFFASLGALPVPMSWSELPAALRQGVVDGYETGFIMSHSAELEQYTKYTTVLNYAYETYLFIANSKAFDQLEPKTRQLLRDKADEACAWGRREIARQEEDSRQIFVENGIVVTELSAEERDAFKEKSRDIVKYLKREYGEEACRAFGIPFEP